MALQFILYVTGKPRLHGLKKREFEWSNDHSCYIYQGRLIDEKEFNVVAAEVLRRYEDMHVGVKIVTPEAQLQSSPLITDIPPADPPKDAETVIPNPSPLFGRRKMGTKVA